MTILFVVMRVESDIFFFFQAEDGIRDLTVTGVQTCALPISGGGRARRQGRCQGTQRKSLDAPGRRREARTVGAGTGDWRARPAQRRGPEIGRASCRERG